MKKKIMGIIDFLFGAKCYECGSKTWWARKCWGKNSKGEGNVCLKCVRKHVKNPSLKSGKEL